MRRKFMIISFLLCLLLLLSACIGHVPEVLRTSSETGTSSEKTKPETTAETNPETTEPETTAETEAKTTEPETTSEEETDTEAASSEKTESETASETEPETTESETEMKSSETEAESSSEEEEQEDPLVGCWIGEEGSVIVLRNDYSALYCEPYNDNRPELACICNLQEKTGRFGSMQMMNAGIPSFSGCEQAFRKKMPGRDSGAPRTRSSM